MTTPAALRTQFPEITVSRFPDAMVQVWLDVADKLVNGARWGDVADFGRHLFAAHHLVLAYGDQAAAARQKLPGQFSGILTSKSADGISASYDASSVTEENGGHWNLTKYGLQYLRLSRMMGIGPIQVGAPDSGVNVSMAWSGPPINPTPG